MVHPTIILLIGVAGSGKTTIGELLSRKLHWPFFDADEFHPSANIKKMSAGIPLDDQDRWPWLENLKNAMQKEITAGESAVFACSALKKSYRDFLTIGNERVKAVYLKGDTPTISKRVAARDDHFMKEEMLASQFAALEEPEGCLTLNVTLPPEEIASEIIRQLPLEDQPPV